AVNSIGYCVCDTRNAFFALRVHIKTPTVAPSTMAGIGEASAIISITQVGFSLAKALNTYLSDVSDASDDISSLVNDIEATLGQLRDLGKLIEKNKTTKAWTDDGLRNAQKCVIDCQQIITKLRKLLKKSTASATSEEVDRDEIDVNKLERALWPFIKPRLEVRRRELQSIKQDIIIAYSAYMTQFGYDLTLLRRVYYPGIEKQAKEHRRRRKSGQQKKSRPRRTAQMPSSKVPPPHAWGYDNNSFYRPHVPEHSVTDDGHDSALEDDGDDESLVYENVYELEREFTVWKAEEEERKIDEEAEKRAIREEAVRSWKEQQLHEVDILWQKTEDERSSLRAELTKQRIAPQQIEEIVNHVHPQAQVNNDLRLLIRNAASDKASSVTSGDGPTEAQSSRRWAIWSKK
ncbi:MAG: hypothetical protein Q9181_008240, partial [Wetmoreana brouardii]